jgi:alkylation response protein AidB-like acyl-CoA dehydrogenase
LREIEGATGKRIPPVSHTEDIFILSDEQRAILETVQRFVEEEVSPRAAALDANPDPEASFSWEIVERAHEVGIRR